MVEGQSRKTSDPRWTAFQILSRLEKESSNSSLLLQQYLPKLAEPKDRHLVTDFVLGVLRWRERLLWLIESFAKKSLDRLDPEVVIILQLGIYQLLFTEIPQHAALYETVRLCKRARLTSAASFVNGILRAVQGKLDSLPEAPVATQWSHPEWLAARWIARFGQKEAKALMKANNDTPQMYLRVNELVTNSSELISNLAAEGVETELSGFGPNVLVVRKGAPQLTSVFLEGAFYIQDAAMEKLGELISPQPDSRVLEISAAPGGKTLQLTIRMKNRGLIVALDSDQKRMRMWVRNMERMKVHCAHPVIADGRALPLMGSFDQVILDAPCSSLGVVRRHPEIKWWKREQDLSGLQTLQLQILEACAKYVRSQGDLIYSVCSFEPEETEEVKQKFLAARTGFEVKEEMYLYPHRDQTDGFFMMKMTAGFSRHVG